jgi:hypothetical protein
MYGYGKLVVALVLAMCLVRGGLAGWFYLFPAAAFEAFGTPQAADSVANYLVRVWGGRDVVIAVLVATASRSYLKPLLVACVAIDSSDFLAATLAHSAGIFSTDQLLAQYATVLAALVPETIALALIIRADSRRLAAAA